mmetsp:Transcript_4141/g.12608  ORF Transcript_4141/g.12608 Transcript_4141/m.12608 type:complete len:257 (+) Transcript_4141:95-865(+)
MSFIRLLHSNLSATQRSQGRGVFSPTVQTPLTNWFPRQFGSSVVRAASRTPVLQHANQVLSRTANTARVPLATAAGVATTAGGLYLFHGYPMWFERPSSMLQTAYAAEASAASARGLRNNWRTASSGPVQTHHYDKIVEESADSRQQQQAEDTGRMSLGTQLGLGSLLGFAAGMALRKFGNALLAVLGAQFIWVQYMTWRGYLTVHWDTILERTTSAGVHFDLDTLLSILTVKIPFKLAFLTSFFGIAGPYFQQFI